MSFAENLQRVRQEKNLTQKEFAKLCGVDRSAVAYWEQGKRTPKLNDLNRIAKALNITISRLLTNDDHAQHIEITKDSIIIKGQKIDISDLDDADLDSIIGYISDIKTKKTPFPAPPKPRSGAKKILIIDDEQEICNMLYSYLVPHGYKVFLAFNGQMGLEYFDEVKPDIVFLDLKMPDIEGIEVLRIIRKVNNAPIVIITGHPEEVSDIFLADLKIEGYIEKPLDLKAVINTLKHIIGE